MAATGNVYLLKTGKPADADVVDADVVDADVVETPNLPAIPQAQTPWPNRAAREAEKTTEMVPAKPKLIERYAERAPKVLTPARFDPEAAALRQRLAWTGTKFLAVDLAFATVRGLALTANAVWHWMMLTDERNAAIADNKFAQRAKDIRETRTKRVKQAIVGAIVLGIGVWVFLVMATATMLVAAGIVAFLGLFSAGFEWRKPRKSHLMGKTTVWGGSVDALRRALIDAKLMKEDQDLRVVVHPHRVGKGVGGTVDLPPGLSVAKVTRARAEVASGLAVDASFLSLEKGTHDGQLVFWAAEGDPFSGGSPKLPLLQAERWNAWHSAPFGRTPRDQEVPLRLVYSNMLLSAKPGAGKTFAARCAAAPYILDPTVRIYAANGKGDAAWDPVEPISQMFVKGRRDEHVFAVNAMLDQVINDMDERYTRMPGSKVVEDDEFDLVLVLIDELQNYTENSTPCDEKVRGKAATIGEVIGFKLTTIVKLGRAAGVILVMVTQKPSDLSLPTELRDQVGTRWSGKVMNWQTSNMILGSNLSTQGYDASQISSKHKGLGILVPDMEEDVLPEGLDDYPMTRSYICDDIDFTALCRRGYQIREAAGLLPTQQLPAPADANEELGEIVEQPLPDLLEAIDAMAADLADGDRISSQAIVDRCCPDSNTKVLGGTLRRWGCPTGRNGGRGPSGPLVRDIRAAVERIRSGGPENMLDTVH